MGAPAPPPEAKRELERLQAEAGIESASDPRPPTGDLASEIESFTSLDSCVRSHAPRDPLIDDAIDALGYHTLTRDACRVLQALKTQDTAPCKLILASPLRARCESSVATLTGDPSLCPAAGEAVKLGARDPECVARASRDERLCAAAASSERATCRALVLGRAAECAGNEGCIRQLERYKTLSGKPDAHAPLAMKIHLDLASQEGTPDPPAKAFDLDDIAAGGALLRAGEDKIRLTVGAPRTPFWPPPQAPLAAAKLYLEVSLPAGGAKRDAPAHDLAPTDLRFDLLLPSIGLFSGKNASQSKLEASDVTAEIGGAVVLVLTTMLHDGARDYRLRIELETFVRDRIGPSAKAMP